MSNRQWCDQFHPRRLDKLYECTNCGGFGTLKFFKAVGQSLKSRHSCCEHDKCNKARVRRKQWSKHD